MSFSFGSTTPSTSGFSFGSSTAPSTGGFTFGQQSQPSTSGFSFGSPQSTTGGFSFGSSTQQPASTGFSFGNTSSSQQSASTGFNFGGSSTQAQPQAPSNVHMQMRFEQLPQSEKDRLSRLDQLLQENQRIASLISDDLKQISQKEPLETDRQRTNQLLQVDAHSFCVLSSFLDRNSPVLHLLLMHKLMQLLSFALLLRQILWMFSELLRVSAPVLIILTHNRRL